jgi:hypothetical protein
MKQRCWFRELPGAGRCDGGLVRCHLISKDRIKKEFPHGAVFYEGTWLRQLPMDAPLDRHTPYKRRSLHALLNDPRVWVWGCGGAVGLSGHHGMLDSSRKLRISRYKLPPALEEYAAELGLGWELDRLYGVLSGPEMVSYPRPGT